MKMLRWVNIIPGTEAMHVAYVERSETGSWGAHGHDFFEIFWVDSGRGVHFVGPDKIATPLLAGQLVFVRSGDIHGFASEASAEPFALINVAFPVQAWRILRERYQLDSHPVFDEAAPHPPVQDLGGEVRNEVSRLFRELLFEPRTELVRDGFLLSLARKWGGSKISSYLDQAPAWLRRGLLQFLADPEAFRAGVPALVRLAGCSTGHLARIMRTALGTSPSAWTMEVRLSRAAQLLESTGFSVTDVAQESGFQNLSHFHRCFRSVYGRTPLRFRKERSSAVM